MGYSTTTDAIATAQRILDTVQSEGVIAKYISEDHPKFRDFSTFNRQNVIRTQLVAHTWRRIGRQVLAMHPEVVDEVRVATSDPVPGEVLRTLPYMNPLVVFASPPTFTSWVQGVHPSVESYRGREHSMRLLGFFAYGSSTVGIEEPILHKDAVKDGVRVEQRIYPTTAPEAERLGMMLVFEVLNEAGEVIDVEFNSMTIFFDGVATLEQTVDDLMTRYHFDAPKGQQLGAHQRKWMRDVMSVVVGTLFYLCSTTLEAEKVPAKTTRHLGRNISRKPLSLYRIGWTTGAALTRLRQQRLTEALSEQGDIGHQQDPQHRRGHFKMQPYGPRNSLRRWTYVSPYWTHLERLGEAGMNVARSVPSLGKGDPKEAVKAALRVRP